MNFLVLQALFADRSAYRLIEEPVAAGNFYPEFGFAPVPAFAAEVG